MDDHSYKMDGEEESIRLDLKTAPKIIKEQALWPGIRPGIRIADLGCGPGKTTFYLNKLVQPGGMAIGVDISEKRIDYAQAHYSGEGGQDLLPEISVSY